MHESAVCKLQIVVVRVVAADIEIGHLTTRLCHLGNIAHRVGRKLTFDAANLK